LQNNDTSNGTLKTLPKSSWWSTKKTSLNCLPNSGFLESKLSSNAAEKSSGTFLAKNGVIRDNFLPDVLRVTKGRSWDNISDVSPSSLNVDFSYQTKLTNFDKKFCLPSTVEIKEVPYLKKFSLKNTNTIVTVNSLRLLGKK